MVPILTFYSLILLFLNNIYLFINPFFQSFMTGGRMRKGWWQEAPANHGRKCPQPLQIQTWPWATWAQTQSLEALRSLTRPQTTGSAFHGSNWETWSGVMGSISAPTVAQQLWQYMTCHQLITHSRHSLDLHVLPNIQIPNIPTWTNDQRKRPGHIWAHTINCTFPAHLGYYWTLRILKIEKSNLRVWIW